MKTQLRIIALSATALLVARCSMTTVAGGGGEVTNGVCTVSGVAREGVSVTAFPCDYIPAVRAKELPGTVSDSAGAFALEVTDERCNMYLVDTTIGRGAFLFDVVKGTDIGIVALDSLGAIAGTVERPSTDTVEPIDVYIRGSPFIAVLTGDLDFVLTRVPAASFTLTTRAAVPTPCDSGMVCLEPPDSVSASVTVTVTAGEPALVDTIRFQ
jgi:hypothetical protein